MATLINKRFNYINPKVSVIIPNYNYEKFLHERIESVINQSYQDFEIIILDDCSSDNSREIIEMYRDNPHVSKIIYNEENSGSPFIQWERGINASSGEWIWIAESDDTADLKFLETLINAVNKRNKSTIAYSHSYMIDIQGNVLKTDWDDKTYRNKILVYNSQNFIHSKLIWNCCIYNASMVIFKKSAFYSIRNSYKKYSTCGDWAFWLEICSQGEVIEICKKLNYFRQHPKRATENAAKKGNDWKEVADILNNSIKNYDISGFELRCFRGKWTKDFNESHSPYKKEIKKLYPIVFNGNITDIFCYKYRILTNRYKKNTFAIINLP